jgi:hypothetical protein
MPIWVDYRESALLTLSPSLKSFTPPVGDIWIGDLSGMDLLSGGVILERKTAADLEASILDGRYKEQRGRLLAYANQHKVAIGYVIEGSLDRFYARIGQDALMKHITRLQFHHRIPVLQTPSLKETLHISELIEQQWVKEKGQFAWSVNEGNTPVASSYVKSACRDSPETFFLGVLTQCRGISEAIARLIASKYPSLQSLLLATPEELATVSSDEKKRKVGLVVATRLLSLLRKE